MRVALCKKQLGSQATRPRWVARFVAPQCEQLEERLALALFNVLTPLSFSGLSNNNNVAVSDLNKDGLADAILTNFGTDYGAGAASTITVLYGRSGGGFTRVPLNTGGKNVSFVSIADINGDTWPDVVVANANQQNTGSVSVFRNDGAGNLALFGNPFLTFGNNSSWVGLSDVTGDGVLDAIVASFGRDDGTGTNTIGNNVAIFQGDSDALGKGNFYFSSAPITTLAPSPQFWPTSLAVADFDGDGLKDIAAAVPGAPPDFSQPQPPGSVYVFRGGGLGAFAAPNQFASGGVLPVDIKAADLNGDIKPDLVIANAGDPNANPEFSGDAVGVLLNNSSPGNPGFGATTSLTANCHGTFAVAVADFDLNGKMDIAAVNFGAQLSFSPPTFVSLYMGDGTGTFTPGSPATYDTRTNSPGGQYLAVGDFDANGTSDLIVAHATNLVGLLLNTTALPGPGVLGSQFAYVTGPQRLIFAFNQNVSASLGLNDITVQRLGGGTVTPAILSFDANNIATVNFSGILADGNYRATLHASGITNSSGTPMASDYVVDFFFLNGDLNRDRQVTIADFITLASNFGKTSATYGDGDLNYDGLVSIADFIDLAANFNKSLPPPTPEIASQAPASEAVSLVSATADLLQHDDGGTKKQRRSPAPDWRHPRRIHHRRLQGLSRFAILK